jgi:glycosyltransferase involved in cell wall biosynthesis
VTDRSHQMDADAGLTAIAVVTGRAAPWRATAQSLLRSGDVERLAVVSTPGLDAQASVGDLDGVEVFEDALPFARVSKLANDGGRDFLLCIEPVLIAPGALGRARHLVADDARIATVSFLANAAGYLSLPFRNQPTHHQIERYDEVSLNDRLRELDPVLGHVPLAVAAGALTLVAWPAFATVYSFVDPPDGDAALALAELSLRASSRGFTAALEASTFVSRPFDLGMPGRDPLADPATRNWLHARHHFFPALHDEQRDSGESPVALAVHVAASKVLGLRVNIDGTCLGPKETGTQVQTLALVRALADRDDVRWVGVTVTGAPPRYSQSVLTHPKVRVFVSPDASFESAEPGDVVHRPFQPDRPLPFDRWDQIGLRTVVTLQDLIAYQVGAYHLDGQGWLDYRRHLVGAVSRADGTVVISHDTARNASIERLPIPADRLFVVPNGTDHLSGSEEAVIPTDLLRRGGAAGAFIAVLGTNFGHKNRDLAIRAWQILRDRGVGHRLVLVGAAVPFGSSREAEAAATGVGHGEIVCLPDVAGDQRNWLLRHADVLMYPTSAEGFGLVPFEAARFGTPTALVSFGPLAEVLPDLPVRAASWDPGDLADATEALLRDPALAMKQVEAVLASGLEYRWDRTAAGLTRAYRSLLALPRRVG